MGRSRPINFSWLKGKLLVHYFNSNPNWPSILKDVSLVAKKEDKYVRLLFDLSLIHCELYLPMGNKTKPNLIYYSKEVCCSEVLINNRRQLDNPWLMNERWSRSFHKFIIRSWLAKKGKDKNVRRSNQFGLSSTSKICTFYFILWCRLLYIFYSMMPSTKNKMLS